MACRSCAHSALEEILSLGRVPLANALLTLEDVGKPEETWPLTLAFCPNCALVQLEETVPPEKLFREYLYFSSFSDTMLKHAEEHAASLIRDEELTRDSQVLEIASNDGYLLQYFLKAGIPVQGIEPARNIAEVARKKGIDTLSEFFDAKLAATLEKADVVVANNVLAHVADLNGFVEGIKTVLKPGGVATIEVPYVREMVDRCEFDTIYHEHLCYFSVTSLDALFTRHGLALDRVERLPIHGGSLLLYVRHEASDRSEVEALLKEEQAWGADRKSYYRLLAHRVAGMREALRSLLDDLKREGKRIAGYGAAAKATTLLNCFRIGREYLEYVVDRSPHKQGHYVPGVVLPILPVERLLEDQPDYVVLFAWNFAEEILRQQAEYRKRGGRFIVFVPEVRIL